MCLEALEGWLDDLASELLFEVAPQTSERAEQSEAVAALKKEEDTHNTSVEVGGWRLEISSFVHWLTGLGEARRSGPHPTAHLAPSFGALFFHLA